MTAREAELIQQLAESQQALAAALRENQLLRQKVDLLVRRVFGSSSEKLDSAQLQLLLLSEAPAAAAEALPVAPSQTPRASRTRPPKAPRLPDNLPVIEEVIDPEPVGGGEHLRVDVAAQVAVDQLEPAIGQFEGEQAACEAHLAIERFQMLDAMEAPALCSR
jgi:hypothetical protein